MRDLERMKYSTRPPDRRIVQRCRFALPCVVDVGLGEAVPGILRQLDPYGARVRLLARVESSIENIAIVTRGGVEIFGTTKWVDNDVVGIQRHTKFEASLARPKSLSNAL